MHQDAWIREFNPFIAHTPWAATATIYEPLMIYNAFHDSGELVPWLATSYEWDETDHVLTFELRNGVQWSDGEPFTANDVVCTFNLLREHPESGGSSIWEFLREVRADSEDRVVFVFEHTFAIGLVTIAQKGILPAHVWQNVSDISSFHLEDPVGTGPFTEVLQFSGDVFELGRNPRYWQPGKPAVAALRFPAYADNDAVIADLKAGVVDWSNIFIPHAEQTYEAADPQHRDFWAPLTEGVVFLYLNTTRSPFDQVEVRKALSMAIDREPLATQAMQGLTRPADDTGLGVTLERYKSTEAVEQGSWVVHDPSGAAKLLDRAGYPQDEDGARGPAGGEPFSFEILVPGAWSDWVQATELIAEQLAAIGVRATPKKESVGDFFAHVHTGEFDIAIGFLGEGPTPYDSYLWLMSEREVRPVGEAHNINWERFGDAKADALLQAVEMTSETQLQEELYRQLQLRFVELAPAIPLFYNPACATSDSTRFVGFPSEENPYVSLSPSHQPQCLILLTSLRPRTSGS